MIKNKVLMRWLSLAPVGALAAALIYLALAGQPSLYG